MREWALRNPHEWALIYGSPVPGYRAPADTVGSAVRVILVIAGIVADAFAAGEVEPGPPVIGPLSDELSRIAAQVDMPAPPQVVARGLTGWIQLCGAVSAELFGQLNNTIDERRAFFEFQMRVDRRRHRTGLTGLRIAAIPAGRR